jgi:hypothetical protein
MEALGFGGGTLASGDETESKLELHGYINQRVAQQRRNRRIGLVRIAPEVKERTGNGHYWCRQPYSAVPERTGACARGS